MSNVILYLNNNQFCPGSVVTGKAICNFRNRIDNVRKIRVRLIGHESTSWTCQERYYDHVSKDHRYRTVRYYGSRDFLLQECIVRGEGAVDMGEYEYPFEFPLPEDLPSSFYHTYGQIKYSMKVTVDIPIQFDYESEQDIIIVSPIKLQSISLAFLEPAQFSDEKTLGYLCCKSGPVQLDVKLNTRACLIGQNINVEVSCSNMSNSNVDSIKAEIIQNRHFKATHPFASYKSDYELVAASRDSGVGAHGEKTFNLILEIPPSTVVPNFYGSEFFSCDSHLKVTAVIHGMHSNMALTTELALGHIPHPRQTVPSYWVDIQPMPMPLVNDFQPMPMPPVNDFQPMPMPSYGNHDKKSIEALPYPPGPSAPPDTGAPSAPQKLGFTTPDLGAGNSSAYEAAPPTYEEAFKK